LKTINWFWNSGKKGTDIIVEMKHQGNSQTCLNRLKYVAMDTTICTTNKRILFCDCEKDKETNAKVMYQWNLY